MTVEFRNLVYSWKYDANRDEKPEECIPWQLQKLFLYLEMSQRRSVETKGITGSFGWADADAFEQHDVQELLRLLFDALEAALPEQQKRSLQHLFGGKMEDFIACKECDYKSSRESDFYDIAIPIKGKGSLEKAIQDFLEPEILDGKNLFDCTGCQKKTEALKGLTLNSLPDILTLQLMRFDYDYNTMRRIKINERCSFPFWLDMAPFLGPKNGRQTDVKANVDSDPDAMEVETSQPVLDENSPFLYELYAVMIHSGSALGGHYYAYLKSLKSKKWYCFNDSNVRDAKESDIEGAFGDDVSSEQSVVRSTHFGTNAYMLLYRRVSSLGSNPEVSLERTDVADIIAEIEKDNSAIEVQRKEAEERRNRIHVHVYEGEHMHDIETSLTATLPTLLQAVHERLVNTVPLDRMRLREYKSYAQIIRAPLEAPSSEETLGQLNLYTNCELFVETRKENEEFEVYDPAAMLIYVHWFEGETAVLPPSIRVNIDKTATVKALKEHLHKKHGYAEAASLRLWHHSAHGMSDELDEDAKVLRTDFGLTEGGHVLAEMAIPSDSSEVLTASKDSLDNSHVAAFIEREKNVIMISFNSPELWKGNDYEPSEQVAEGRLSIVADKRWTLLQLREAIAEKLAMNPLDFKIYEGKYSKKELKDGSKLLGNQLYFTDQHMLYLKLGRPMLPEEYSLHLFMNVEDAKLWKTVEVPSYIPGCDLYQKVAELAVWDPKKLRLRTKAYSRATHVISRHELSLTGSIRDRLYDGFELVVELLQVEDEYIDGQVIFALQEWTPTSLSEPRILSCDPAQLGDYLQKTIQAASPHLDCEQVEILKVWHAKIDSTTELPGVWTRVVEVTTATALHFKNGYGIVYREMQKESEADPSEASSSSENKENNNASSSLSSAPLALPAPAVGLPTNQVRGTRESSLKIRKRGEKPTSQSRSVLTSSSFTSLDTMDTSSNEANAEAETILVSVDIPRPSSTSSLDVQCDDLD
jgi:hypothetical protein